MSSAQPKQPEPSDRDARLGPSQPERPDWLVGAEEGARREPDIAPDQPTRPRGLGAGPPPARPAPPARERPQPTHLKLVVPPPAPPAAPPAPAEPPADAAPAPDAAPGTGTVVWKAAASSIPRLTEQPAVAPSGSSREPSDGFTQDEAAAKAAAAKQGPAPRFAIRKPAAPPVMAVDAGEPAELGPLDRPPGLLAAGLDFLRFLRRPAFAVAAGVVVVLALIGGFALRRSGQQGAAGVSLAQIRQQPESYEGREVVVDGRAGETFAVGQSVVFDLYQGRDTIVVYSHSRHPRPSEPVTVRGTISVGYMDGAPRLALLEAPGSH